MSDDTIGSSQQPAVEPEHRTPDLMDNDPLLENLKALHEETRSDDEGQEDDGQPGTSAPKKREEDEEKNEEPRYYRTADTYHGRFAWIMNLGIRIPSLLLNGEPYMPVEFLRKELRGLDSLESEDNFMKLLDKKEITTRICTQIQFNAIMMRCKVCQSLELTSISLISRSDLDRIMGEVRLESCKTRSEHDNWNAEGRIHIVHVNFVDYLSDFLESDDLDEDPMESGVHGYWYKNRSTMRCIICRQCNKKFTPNDFIVHHHYPMKLKGVVHMGINAQKWGELIEVHSEHRTEVNLDAWNKFRMNSHRIGKRGYDDAEPQEPKKVAREKPIIVDDDDDSMEDDDDEGEEIVPPRKLELADYLGPSGSKGLVPRDKLQKVILDCLNRMDESSLKILFLSTPEEYYAWIKESEFRRKVIAQQKEWEEKLKDPKSRLRTSANFNPQQGAFENMHMLHSASKSTQKEIQLLADKFTKLQEEMNEQKVYDAWEFVLKEKKLLASTSEDALRVLSNRPPPPPKPKVVTPLLPIKPTLPTLPISFSNINLAQVAQQFMATGMKLPFTTPFPLVSPVPSSVPTTSASTPAPSKPLPVLPFPTMPLPTLPVNTNYEILKQQLSLALSSPALFPIFYPKIPSSAYENLVNLLKTTTVKN